MIVILKEGATRAQMDNVVARIEQMGCEVELSQGEERTIIGIIGNGRRLEREQIERMEGVERTVPIMRPFKRASRDFHPQDTIVKLNGVSVGDQKLVLMAGPCAVESREQLLENPLRYTPGFITAQLKKRNTSMIKNLFISPSPE